MIDQTVEFKNDSKYCSCHSVVVDGGFEYTFALH
ncbi:DUF7695 domain-containing protein [Liquorilactobacillus hordei]